MSNFSQMTDIKSFYTSRTLTETIYGLLCYLLILTVTFLVTFSIISTIQSQTNGTKNHSCYINKLDHSVIDNNGIINSECINNFSTADGAIYEEYGVITIAYKQYQETSHHIITWSLIISFIISYVMYKRRQSSRRVCFPFKTLLISFLSALIYFKTGIIDIPALGKAIIFLQNGLNLYSISSSQNASGLLPIFPYNPLALLFLMTIQKMQSILNFLPIHSNNYSLLQVALFITYALLCRELTKQLAMSNLGAKISENKLFIFILLNPLGLYYTVFLGQIDVITVTAFALAATRLAHKKYDITCLLLIVFSVTFGKPQHLLLLPLFILFSIELNDKKKYFTFLALCLLSSLCIYYLYSFVPGFYSSLGSNPQAARVGWSTWWTLLSDAIIINKPLALLTITYILLIFINPEREQEHSIKCHTILLQVGALFSVFQSSFAHTFGLAIFIYPAVIITVCQQRNMTKAFLLWAISGCLLLGWGTGMVGDFTNIFGLKLFSYPKLLDKTAVGMKLSDALNTIEYASYIAYAIIFIMLIGKTKGRTFDESIT